MPRGQGWPRAVMSGCTAENCSCIFRTSAILGGCMSRGQGWPGAEMYRMYDRIAPTFSALPPSMAVVCREAKGRVRSRNVQDVCMPQGQR